MRSHTPLLAIALATAAMFSIKLQAANLTVSADQALTISSATSYENLILKNGATLTLTSNGYVLDITGAISGTGTIELNKGKIGIYADVPSTVAWKITGTGTVTAENRIISRVAGSDNIKKIEGPLTGTGSVRVMGLPASGTGGISVAGDNSQFKGKLIIGKGSYNRFGALTAGGAEMSLEYDGNSGNDGSPDFGGGTLEFGSIYTTSRTTDGYPWRFNDGEYTLEVGALNKNDDRITIKLGESNNTTGKVRIKKVGTGTLELWNVNNRRGIDINGGTVLVTSDGALTNNLGDITFGGGTLKYGVNEWEDDGTVLEVPVAVTTDYSAQIKNSTAEISIDTYTNEISFATALPASNKGGLVKKGKGSLVLSALPKYTGKTVVEEGSLTIPISADPSNETFKVESGAEITYVNNNAQRNTIGDVGETATINLTNEKPGYRLWRCTAYPFSGDNFKGTINFANNGITATVDGLVGDVDALGNSNVIWGVTGEPENDNTLLFYFQGTTAGSKVYCGALRQTSDKGGISIHRKITELEVGNRDDVDSVLNGAVALRTNASEGSVIKKVGGGKLTLGPRFRAVALADLSVASGYAFTDTATNYPAFKITDGTFENNADLSKFPTVTIYKGVKVTGTGKFGKVTYKDANDEVLAEVDAIDLNNLQITAATTKAAEDIAGLLVPPLKEDELEQGLKPEYYKTVSVSIAGSGSSYTYTNTTKLDEKQVAPTFTAENGQAATIEGQSITFNHENMNLKPGLYYAIETTDPDTTQEVTKYRLYREDDTEFSLSADLPESGVRYYKVLVSDNENGN